jgi:L-seryl-tRNA(Ser) seleniumtransferase
VVEVGTVHSTREFHLTDVIGEQTAALVFVVSHHTVRYGCVPLERAVAIAHERNVPVVVDGAAQSFVMQKILAAGVDLAICSGHKYLSGTTAGIVYGREDLVRAVTLQNQGIGRPMKVGKEGIVGTMAALEYRMRLDVEGWEAEQNRKMRRIIDRLGGIEGVRMSAESDPNGNPFSRARMDVDAEQVGLNARAISRAMADGDPSIRVRAHHVDEGYFMIDAIEITDEELELTCDRLTGILTASEAEKAEMRGKYAGQEEESARWSWLR